MAAATKASDAGSYVITAAGLTSKNYEITATPGTLTVDKAALTVTVDDKARSYGSDNPALTATYSGSATLATTTTKVTVTVRAATPGEPGRAASRTSAKVTPTKPRLRQDFKVIAKVKSKDARPTGKVVVKLGKKIVGKGLIRSGKVTLTLKKLKKGKNKLTATYAGDSAFAASKLKFKITVT